MSKLGRKRDLRWRAPNRQIGLEITVGVRFDQGPRLPRLKALGVDHFCRASLGHFSLAPKEAKESLVTPLENGAPRWVSSAWLPTSLLAVGDVPYGLARGPKIGRVCCI
jgi:hypothetical protein